MKNSGSILIGCYVHVKKKELTGLATHYLHPVNLHRPEIWSGILIICRILSERITNIALAQVEGHNRGEWSTAKCQTGLNSGSVVVLALYYSN
jgi:hypothetical protein